jgi:tetratricopeptide (TPR) repeat protein
MPTEIKNDPRHDFTRRILPWLVAAVMLVVYYLTLNPWVSLINIETVARVSGWTWTPDFGGPLFHLVMLPFRMLPAGAIPVALNLFSAICAALTLGLLTRSVGLLPHDRTEAQVIRERNGFALLTLKSAWLPSLLAALLCGLQLTFWELATNGGSAMFDLLLFAFVVWSLLEYRLDEREWRLYLSSVVVGLGIAEGTPMTGFFPLFIVAVIWVRGLNFFNVQFLWRMTLCGLAGLSLFLLPPITAIISDPTSGTFLQAVQLSLSQQAMVARDYFDCLTNPTGSLEKMVPLFVSLIPLLILSIRWKIGDSSRVGSVLANLMYHGIHAIFLCVCVWLAFDPPFSPRQRGLGLTLYYLIALSAGYYAGYFLLIFGKKHPRAGEFQPILVVLANRAIITLVWLLAILAVAGLVYKNKPLVSAINGNSLAQYASLQAGKLPRGGAIVLSDSRTQLFLTKAELAREGRAKDFLLLDTTSLLYPQYHRYLHWESPEKWPLLVAPTNSAMLNPVGMVGMLSMLNRSNELYYLQPSFGYYFEQFYPEPHGLVYKLKLLPNDTLLPAAPDNNLIAENEAFWADAQSQTLKSVEDTLALPDPNSPEPFAQKILARLHIPREQSISDLFVGACCSRCLDFWGVEQQRTGFLTTAAESFKTALQLNPDNAVAQINLKFNEALRAGQHPRVDLNQDTSDQLGKYSSVGDAISEGGPFDEPAFCYQVGYIMINDNGFFRQAAAPLERVCELDPNFFPARSLLARIYGMNHLPNRMLTVLRAPIEKPETFSLDLADSAELHVLAAAAYFQLDDPARGSQMFEMEISRDPGNDALLSTVEKVYLSRGMFSNALVVADNRLKLTPDDPKWLITKGYVENQLKQYNDAIKTLTRVIAVQNDNGDALFQRARAYYLSGNLGAAQTDYESLQKIRPNSPVLAYALGEIAQQQHNTNEAIQNFELYLRTAPTNTDEAKSVSEQLHKLKQPAGGK